MPTAITTPYGHAIPPAPRHSVTVHIPTWSVVDNYRANVKGIVEGLYNAYPRMKPHRDIASLGKAVLKHLGLDDHKCFLFSSIQSARECVEYSTSPRRDDGQSMKPARPEQLGIRAMKANEYFFAVTYPPEAEAVVSGFWPTPGVGISSRFAEANLEALDALKEVAMSETIRIKASFETSWHGIIRERIVYYLDRAALNSDPKPRPTTGDVYLFPTGMAAIYRPHRFLNHIRPGTTVLFGMAFTNTVTLFQEYGEGWKFFGCGTDDDADALEAFLEEEQQHGRRVQAIWAEFPANPNLVTPDLARLRGLADKYDTVLAIDDTIASFANVDVTHVSDLLVTSLTKSFNGYADVIAGSVVLNPASRKYSELKPLFDEYYIPELYAADAATIELNSRDYLARTAKLNHNALALVDYLQSHTAADDRTSAVSKIFYPSINPSGKHYRQFLRQPTPDLPEPGFGCVFTIELADLASTAAFFDRLEVHKGPHLGAHRTLAFAYTKILFGPPPAARLEWAGRYGLKPTQIRISVGLEDTQDLVEVFTAAVEAADEVYRTGIAMTPVPVPVEVAALLSKKKPSESLQQ